MSDIRYRKTPERVEASAFDSNSNHSFDSTNDIIMSQSRRTVSGSPERRGKINDVEMSELAQPLVSGTDIPLGAGDKNHDTPVAIAFVERSDFYVQGLKLLFCYAGLQASYLTWGYMQELIMTSDFEPTERVPDGRFPSAAFCVFSNRFLAVIVGAISCRIRHGAFFANNTAPFYSFIPCALSNTLSSWSQYASLKFVAFPVQTVFKSSKIIPVMMMGKFLKGTIYPMGQYAEALLITIGVAIFSLSSKTSDQNNSTQVIGLLFMTMYICCDSFTSQWQSKIYESYGKSNVDQYQMMLGVNSCAIFLTTAGLIITGDFPIVHEFLLANPIALRYNIITAITSATGQLFIFYTIKEFGPIVFTVMMTTRQLFSITISCIIFGHTISMISFAGAALVFSVIFYQIRRKYLARLAAQNSS